MSWHCYEEQVCLEASWGPLPPEFIVLNTNIPPALRMKGLYIKTDMRTSP